MNNPHVSGESFAGAVEESQIPKLQWRFLAFLWLGLPSFVAVLMTISVFVVPVSFVIWAWVGLVAALLCYVVALWWTVKTQLFYAGSAEGKPNWWLGASLWLGLPTVFLVLFVVSIALFDFVALVFFIGIPMSLIAGWVWAVLTVGDFARSKGYSKTGFVVFAVFMPLIALIVVLVIQPSTVQREQVAAATLSKCPMCAELVQREAKVCKHCGRDIEPAVEAPALG